MGGYVANRFYLEVLAVGVIRPLPTLLLRRNSAED